jgi:hypothetical protein
MSFEVERNNIRSGQSNAAKLRKNEEKEIQFHTGGASKIFFGEREKMSVPPYPTPQLRDFYL